MFIARVIFFTMLFPGTVTVIVPYFLVLHGHDTSTIPHPLWAWLGLLPLGVGLPVLFRCIWDFAVAGHGTLAPVDPPKELVVRGLYRYVRNPMYVGVLCILSGEALLFVSEKLIIYALIFFACVHIWVVIYEEPTLRRKFGESYERYTRTVHRWLPRRPPKTSS